MMVAAATGAPSDGGHTVCWAALWTKQLTKKRKVYHDGFLLVDCRGGSCRLVAEDGAKELARSTSPVALQELEDDAEGLTCCEGYLINLDGRADLPPSAASRSAADGETAGGHSCLDNGSPEGGKGWRPPAGDHAPSLPISNRLAPVLSRGRPCHTTPSPSCSLRGSPHKSLPPQQAPTAAGVPGAQQQQRQQQQQQWGRAPLHAPAEPKQRTDEEILHILHHGLPREQDCPRQGGLGDLHGQQSPIQAKPRTRAQPAAHLGHTPSRRSLQCMQPRQPAPATSQSSCWAKESKLANWDDQEQASRGQNIAGGSAACENRAGACDMEASTSVGMAAATQTQASTAQPQFRPAPISVHAKLAADKLGVMAPHTHRGSSQLHSSAAVGTACIEFPGRLSLCPTRHQTSTNGFGRWAQYVTAWSAIIKEEINLRGVELVSRLRGAVASAEASGPAGASSMARKMGGRLYPDCELSVSLRHGRSKKRRRKGGDFDEEDGDWGDDDDGGPSGDRQKHVFLTLRSGVQRASAYRKDDIWYLSPSPQFGLQSPGGAPGRCARVPTIYVARALWHGPDKNGRMAVEVLNVSTVSLPKSQRLHGLQGPNASIELAMLRALDDSGASVPMAQEAPPLLQALIQQPSLPAPLPTDQRGDITSESETISDTFGLNEEQSSILRTAVAPWFSGRESPTASPHSQPHVPPVCLIHGPFGTGKSSLLVALNHFITSRLSSRGPSGRGSTSPQVLVTAHTNVAVDRVMRGLVESGMSDIVRVGSLKRISDKSLLRYSLHSGDGKRGSDAVKDLQEMLQEARGDEAKYIRAELEALRAGGDRHKAHLLNSAKVVGVTCCSASLPVLKGRRFEVLVLDESSQMVEPLSLLPILSSNCRYLIAAGDPCQLPPVVASPERPVGAQPHQGLARPLFTRLCALGHKPHLLRRQYRCHPDISAVPNQMFYQGTLLDGCSEGQRAPLVPGLPALCMVDVDKGDEQRSADSASVSNSQEAAAVARIIGLLTRAGIPAEDMGVICFFRAQAQLVSRALSRQAGLDGTPVQVATVDSFQGAEKKVVVLSTAVTRPGSTFSSDAQRLNVALTRAKHHLIIVGCVRALQGSGRALQEVIARCSARQAGLCRHAQPPDALLQAQAEPAAQAT